MIDFLTIQHLQDRAVSTAAERYLLVYMIGVLVIVTTLVIVFFIVFQKRKNKILMDKLKQQQAFDEEISRAQTEIQEQTLKQVGWELHDNVGQLLAFANMQMNMLLAKTDDGMKESVQGAADVIKESLNEVRALSRTLNSDVISNMGLEASITNELNRIKKMKFSSAELKIEGSERMISNKKHEIVLFRILQEFLSNSVKYSQAQSLKVTLDFQDDRLRIEAVDDGVGFEMESVAKGSGLINMSSRAELIGAALTMWSEPNKGTQLKVDYPYT